MRLAPNDAMAATAALNTGGNLGGVIGTALVAALSAQGPLGPRIHDRRRHVIVAALLWLTINPGRGERT